MIVYHSTCSPCTFRSLLGRATDLELGNVNLMNSFLYLQKEADRKDDPRPYTEQLRAILHFDKARKRANALLGHRTKKQPGVPSSFPELDTLLRGDEADTDFIS